MITKPKNRKVLIGIVAAIILILGLICGSITIAGNTPERRADQYLDLGDKYLSELDYEQALVAYRQVLEIEPKNLAAYKGGLAAYAGLGDSEGMAELYIDALGVIEGLTEQELKPVYDIAVEIYLYADAVYTDDHEAAAQALERGFDTLGRDERLIRALIAEYGILAGVYIDAGDYEREQEIYQKIVEKNLENSDALSGWEQRVRERFQEYLDRNGESGNAPEPTPEPAQVHVSTSIVLQGNVKDSGEYKGLNWWVTDAGELAVTGNMEGEGLDSTNVWKHAPWKQYSQETTVAYMSFTGAKSLWGLFEGLYLVLSKVYFNGLDTSSVTDMGCMFYCCESLSSVDLSSFDTRNVTSMQSMFWGCRSLSSVDLSGFDTSRVTDMYEMFSDCESLSSLDLSSFDTSSVTNMSCMFAGCRSLGSLDLSGFDTSSVGSMSSMFRGCESLSSLDLSSFDTSNVTGMTAMFYNCRSIQEILVGDGWKGYVTVAGYMFDNCGVSEVTHK